MRNDEKLNVKLAELEAKFQGKENVDWRPNPGCEYCKGYNTHPDVKL